VKFLREIRRILKPGDSLLLGTDLEKPLHQLIAAYDDALGVTAAFNLNLLARINRELEADFDLAEFEHEARFNQASRSIEMHLKSRKDQLVSVPRADIAVQFAADETIWTETTHKYSHHELLQIAMASGFRFEAQWVDAEWPFAENLWIAQ